MNTAQKRYTLEAERKIKTICKRTKIPIDDFKDKLTKHFGRSDSQRFNQFMGEIYTYEDGSILNAYETFTLAYEENYKGICQANVERKKKLFTDFLLGNSPLVHGEKDNDLSDLNIRESAYNPIDMDVNEEELEYELKRMENEEN